MMKPLSTFAVNGFNVWRPYHMVTDGIRVTISSVLVPEMSSPKESRFMYAYQVVIKNEGRALHQSPPFQLSTRVPS